MIAKETELIDAPAQPPPAAAPTPGVADYLLWVALFLAGVGVAHLLELIPALRASLRPRAAALPADANGRVA